MDKELELKLARYIVTIRNTPVLDCNEAAKHIGALIKGAGWKSPEECEELQAELTDQFATEFEKRVAGYAKLTSDQIPPINPYFVTKDFGHGEESYNKYPHFQVYQESQQDVFKAGWQKVEGTNS